MRGLSAAHRALLRGSGWRLGADVRGSRIALLTTTGRRSGRRRTVPLLCLEEDDALLVVASNGGATSHPAWYHNLLADPHATVQIARDRTLAVIAEPVPDEDRDAVWRRFDAAYPAYERYRAKTSRSIPLVRLRHTGAV